MHFQAYAERQVVAVGVGLQNGLHHALHQRGQRNLRMPCDFDLQLGGTVRAQPLRQPIRQARGLRRFVGVSFVLVRASAVRETLPLPVQRAQRLGLGFTQQPAMDDGFALAVDADDGTGDGAHVRGVALRGFLDGLQFAGHLRTKRRFRRSRNASYRGQGRGAIIDAVSIRERPPEVEDRAVPGHWEGDLVEGSRGTYIATLVERQSRFVVLVKLSEKGTEAVVDALIKAVRKLPTALRKSLTWDRGTELASHATFTVATNVQVYFCDPSSPWQRGSNENTNGLLRQY